MKMFPVAILAGGLATRLGTWTKTVPKSLLEVAGEPFLAHQLRYLAGEGITEVTLCIGHLAEQIEQFAGDGSAFGLRIKYSRETDGLLGTGGALRKALPLLGEQFFLLYGDSWLEINYMLVAEAFVKSGRPALMTVYRNEGKWDTSNVEVGESQILLYSKTERNERMCHIDYGLGILTREVLKDFPQGQAFGLEEIYEKLSLNQQLAYFEATSRFYEIGSKEGFQELEKILCNKK